MEKFTKQSLISCYNESKTERCTNCSLLHAVKSLPNGIETTLTNLISKVLEPAAEAYGKPIQVVKGFRCPILQSLATCEVVLYDTYIHIERRTL